MSSAIVKIKGINKSFGDHKVLSNFNETIADGEFVLLLGESGCGKSTLLNIVGLLDTYDSGLLTLFGDKAPKPYSKQAIKLLREKIGYLFQNFALVDNKTVKYNLEIAMESIKKSDRKERIEKALEEVGLPGYQNKYIYQCSGGEQQRIAIARLLLKPCQLVLCDEPTGSLDTENKENIMKLLLKLQEQGKTLIVVTHDLDMKAYATRVVELTR